MAQTGILERPAPLRKAIDEYFALIDSTPARTVQIGKNFYTRAVPHTVEGLCSHLGVQKNDVKKLLTSETANAECRRLMVTAITRIEAKLTEQALLGELEPTVAKIVLAGSLLTETREAEVDGKNGLTIVIKGMTAKQAEEAQQ